MKILKFGLKYWKKNLILAIIIQLVSYIAIVADVLLPLISELFIDYIITDSHGSTKGVFAFLLNGKYGQPRTFECFTIFFVFNAISYPATPHIYQKY